MDSKEVLAQKCIEGSMQQTLVDTAMDEEGRPLPAAAAAAATPATMLLPLPLGMPAPEQPGASTGMGVAVGAGGPVTAPLGATVNTATVLPSVSTSTL